LNKKYNILFLASWYPNKTSPQAGNFIQKHAKAVAAFSNVSVLHVVSRIQKDDFIIERKSVDNLFEVIVYYKKITSKVPLLSNFRKFKTQLTAYKKGFEIILTEFKKIHLVHLNVIFPAGIFALNLKKKMNIPYIITEHWTAFLKSDPNKITDIQKHYINKISTKAHCICPVSEDLKSAMIEFGINENFKVIPNVVDTELFQYRKKTTDNKLFKILHVSNLKDEQKNISGLLRVIKQLSNTKDNFIITIAGNGDIDTFRKKAKELIIPDKVIRFDGEKTTSEVAALMNENDLFLLFSNYENLPCVISEALVSGLPVLSSNVGGIGEMINDKNGILIEKGNEEALLSQLNKLINNYSLFDTEEFSKKASEIYSYETIGKSYYSIYKSILD
jgi:glycosyltransferase involved in cell wall biosynthesis